MGEEMSVEPGVEMLIGAPFETAAHSVDPF